MIPWDSSNSSRRRQVCMVGPSRPRPCESNLCRMEVLVLALATLVSRSSTRHQCSLDHICHLYLGQVMSALRQDCNRACNTAIIQPIQGCNESARHAMLNSEEFGYASEQRRLPKEALHSCAVLRETIAELGGAVRFSVGQASMPKSIM